jgi:hypothetical protein
MKAKVSKELNIFNKEKQIKMRNFILVFILGFFITNALKAQEDLDPAGSNLTPITSPPPSNGGTIGSGTTNGLGPTTFGGPGTPNGPGGPGGGDPTDPGYDNGVPIDGWIGVLLIIGIGNAFRINNSRKKQYQLKAV